MKRRMKQKKYGILMVVGIIAVVLMPFAPCRAEWIHIYSDVASGPTEGYNPDSDSGPGWSWEYEEGFLITDIDTYADSSGASASANCYSYCSGQVMVWGQANKSISPSASCASWGRSLYADPDPPSPLPDISWSVYGSGTVTVGGSVSGNSADCSSNASGGMYTNEGSGVGLAYGSVSSNDFGSAGVDWDENTTKDYSDVDDEEYEWFYATLEFSVEGGDPVLLDEEETQYEAYAEVWSSSDFSASSSDGEASAGSSADCGGSSSVSVSLP